MTEQQLTHIDDKGDVRMVDVSQKADTERVAVAEGFISMHPDTLALIVEGKAAKGDVLACARVAGVMAAKQTSTLIPMCHPLNITKAKVECEPVREGERTDGRVGIHVTTTTGVTGKTGIEMEALTAASVACLTIYDMCKAVDRGMEVVDVRLLRKEGGRSGIWERTREEPSAAEAVGSEAVEAPAPARPAPAIAFIGYQNAGKTTLVEKVIAELTTRGLRVGSVKHHGHHGFDIDVPGKDSWRHARAGSRHVGLVCETRYAEYADTDTELPLPAMLARFTDVDVVIVEGYKTAGLPNVVVARSGVDRLRQETSLNLVDENTVALACNDAMASRVHLNLPVIDINDAVAVADAVQAWMEGIR